MEDSAAVSLVQARNAVQRTLLAFEPVRARACAAGDRALLYDAVGQLLVSLEGITEIERVAALAAALSAALQRPGPPDRLPVEDDAVVRALDRMARLLAMRAATGFEPAGGDPDLLAALHAERAPVEPRLTPAPLTPESAEAVWEAMHRMATATAVQMHKSVEIVIEPTARELPTALVSALRGALGRILRYGCVYSVELEPLRRAHGKRGAGAIRVSALNVGTEVVICVSDDGAGLDLKRLRARAAAMKLISRAEAANMTDTDAAALVFAPGLSSFGELGGDGGLDRAKAEIERLGGAIEVNTLAGRGATFLIRAPFDCGAHPTEIMGASR